MWRCRSGHAGLRSRRNLKEDERGRAGEATAARANACAFSAGRFACLSTLLLWCDPCRNAVALRRHGWGVTSARECLPCLLRSLTCTYFAKIQAGW